MNTALEAAAPDSAVRAHLEVVGNDLRFNGRNYRLEDFRHIQILGAGKAAAVMARAIEELLGERLTRGMVVVPYGHGLDLAHTQVLEAGHPVPDQKGEHAGREMLRLAGECSDGDLVLFLLSGGASALLPAPFPPVTLADMQQVTRLLLAGGAPIREINTLRRHLSRIKGGRLARALSPARTLGLVISDVIGDRLEDIGSGPTAPDPTTFKDCLTILHDRSILDQVPESVLHVLQKGAEGKVEESVKPGHTCFKQVENRIVANNARALQAAARAAQKVGYEPVLLTDRLDGEAREAAVWLVERATRLAEDRGPEKPPLCLLAGGETTVTVRGKGQGGRNQELALAACLELQRRSAMKERVFLACLGTDGRDGPTDAAGAMVFPDTLDRARHLGLDGETLLADNDSHPFFQALGDLIHTGPTLTNVMDLTIVLIEPRPA